MTALETGPPPALRVVGCTAGDCRECNGWIGWGPPTSAGLLECPCRSCTHPQAWTRRQAADQLLGLLVGAYPGEEVLEYRDGRGSWRELEPWPGSTARPLVLEATEERDRWDLRRHVQETGAPLYFTPPTTSGDVRDLIRQGLLGAILTPKQGNKLEPGMWHLIDNGCFQQGGAGYPGDDAFLRWLETLQPYRQWCVGVSLPDVVGNHWATLERSYPMLPRVQELGYPANLVLQNGEELGYPTWEPWEDGLDGFFIGGDDRYKLADHTASLTRLAAGMGMWVHMGRVNSLLRLKRAAREFGAHSADGTTILMHVTKNAPQVVQWREELWRAGPQEVIPPEQEGLAIPAARTRRPSPRKSTGAPKATARPVEQDGLF